MFDIFIKILLEFEAECQCYSWFFDTIKQQFLQYSQIEPMKMDSYERFLANKDREIKFMCEITSSLCFSDFLLDE